MTDNEFEEYIRHHSDENGNMSGLTLEEIGNKFGVSKTRIRFILKEAFEELSLGVTIEDLEDF